MDHVEFSRKGGKAGSRESKRNAALARWQKSAAERAIKRAQKIQASQTLKALPATSPA